MVNYMLLPLPRRKLEMRGERSRTLMSLFLPGIPKKVCQIHKDLSATASKIILRNPSLSWNCPYQATGQFFQVQCMQSIDANILGNPRAVLIEICFSKSSRDGWRKKVDSKQPRIATQKRRRASLVVLAPSRTYSLVASTATP
jgi:hypothetical protein